MSKFVIFPARTGVKFHLTAANGETVAVSEVYSSAAQCRRGIEAVRRCAAAGRIADLTAGETELTNPKFEVYLDRRGSCRFRLRSRNGKIIASSEAYTTKAGCLAGIQSVIHTAPTAQVEE